MPRLTTSSAALALALALAGCGMPAPTFSLPRDDGPHFASGSGHRAEAAIARRREAQDRAAERLWRWRVLRALEEDD